MRCRLTFSFPFWFCLILAFFGCAPINHHLETTPDNPAAVWENSLGMPFIRIPAGQFIAGSPIFEKERSANEVQHQVIIGKSFWLGATHVTVGQFAAFVESSGPNCS
jgi:formylglycine-generating enzyme required for sulfatase activity